MARPVFEIARDFQNKVKEDIQSGYEFKDTVRKDFVADAKVPEALRTTQLNTRNAEFDIDELNQNFGTDLATSGLNAQNQNQIAGDKVSSFAGEKTLRDNTRNLDISQIPNSNVLSNLELTKSIEETRTAIAQMPMSAEKTRLETTVAIQEADSKIRNAQSIEELKVAKIDKELSEAKYAVENAQNDNDLKLAQDALTKAQANADLLSIPEKEALAASSRALLTIQNEAAIDQAPETAAKQTLQLELDNQKLSNDLENQEQKELERELELEKNIAILQSDIANEPDLAKKRQLQAQKESLEYAEAIAANPALVAEARAKEARSEATLASRARSERATADAKAIEAENRLTGLRNTRLISDWKAEIPEFDLMDDFSKYDALYRKARKAKANSATLRQINMEMRDSMTAELEALDAYDLASDNVDQFGNPMSNATSQRAVNKAKRLMARINPEMILLALDNGALKEDEVTDKLLQFLEGNIDPAAGNDAEAIDPSTGENSDVADTSVATTAPQGELPPQGTVEAGPVQEQVVPAATPAAPDAALNEIEQLATQQFAGDFTGVLTDTAPTQATAEQYIEKIQTIITKGGETLTPNMKAALISRGRELAAFYGQFTDEGAR